MYNYYYLIDGLHTIGEYKLSTVNDYLTTALLQAMCNRANFRNKYWISVLCSYFYFGIVAGAGDDPATLGYEPNEIPISTTPRCKDKYYFCDSIHEIRINNVNNESTLYVMRNRGVKREKRV